MLGDCGGPATVWSLLCVGVPQGQTESGGVGHECRRGAIARVRERERKKDRDRERERKKEKFIDMKIDD